MGVIGVLDFSVANLIAAGEVVDRPGSVVKELLENAIDAGATQITVEVKRGGVSFLRVSDNGCGMSREDAPLSLRRHATSKIHTAEDLGRIFTLGFRGEALAAISAVSKLRMMTKRKEDTVGTLLYSEGGVVKTVEDAGCPNGTTIVVEELFYNVPARMKFLKKDATETANVIANTERVALSHPEVSFRLICDGESRLVTAGDGNVQNTLYAVYGRAFAKQLAPVSGAQDGLALSGFIGTPENIRSNRNFQLFYVNERYVRSKTMSAALEQAFTSFIPQDKFPCCTLYLTLQPDIVDVNVHPAKLEVKFSNEKAVFELVYYAVRNALENTLARPQFDAVPAQREKSRVQDEVLNAFVPLEKSERAQPQPLDLAAAAPPQEQNAPAESFASAPQVFEPQIDLPKTVWNPTPIPSQGTSAASAAQIPTPNASQPHYAVEPRVPQRSGEENIVCAPITMAMQIPYRIVGELFETYVIVEYKETSYLIDKHAAHERILFEQLRENAKKEHAQSFLLLVPLKIVLSSEEAASAAEHAAEIEKTGFRFVIDGKTASLHEIPSYMDPSQATAAFVSLAGDLSRGQAQTEITTETAFERALYQASCKAAIKGGRAYDRQHIEWICDRLFSLPDIKYCPHGRPVCIEVTKASLEHRFKRS